MAQFLEQTETDAREAEDTETADQMALVLGKMRRVLAEEMLA
jgi:hypothetical protein